MGVVPASGDPVPGEVRHSLLSAAGLGIALLCVGAIAALRRTPKPARATMWLALIPGVLLTTAGIAVDRAYAAAAHLYLLVALLMILCGPIVTLLLTRFRSGAARVYITALALLGATALIALFEFGLHTR